MRSSFSNHTCAVALLCVILLGAWATTTAQAQRPVAPDHLSRSRLRGESWVPPPPVVFWLAGRNAYVSRRHRFGQFFGPGLAYSPWTRPGHYWYHGGTIPYFFHPPLKDVYGHVEAAVAVPQRSEGRLSDWVAKWEGREPGVDRPNHGLFQSALFKEGMSEEDIVRAVGAPIDRRRTAEGEIWKYTSYSLVVAAGKLVAVR